MLNGHITRQAPSKAPSAKNVNVSGEATVILIGSSPICVVPTGSDVASVLSRLEIQTGRAASQFQLMQVPVAVTK